MIDRIVSNVKTIFQNSKQQLARPPGFLNKTPEVLAFRLCMYEGLLMHQHANDHVGNND